MRVRWFVIVVTALCATGCPAEGGGPQCQVGADCASGMCQADGFCVPLDAGTTTDGARPDTGGELDSGTEDGALPTDASTPDAEVDGSPIDAGGGCVPNHDGRIERSEVTLRAGLRATFRVATDAPVDTTGEVGGDSSRTWDFSEELSGERDVLVDLRSPEGLWFEEDFPGATYVTELSSEEDLLGVFQVTSDALLLMGVASPEDSFTSTKLTYDPPVEVLSFPIEMGNTWTTESSVSGTALGVISVYDETYDNEVDAAGELETPFGTFDVLRIRVTLTREVGVAPFAVTTTIRTFAFASECFGTVATVNSGDNETQVEFAEAAEIRRLAP